MAVHAWGVRWQFDQWLWKVRGHGQMPGQTR